ncbi:HAD-like domain-containing protein [Linnemannia elongata]|nr:HAD-like domain-containing protein [Linnemannia elongata]
MAEMSSDQDTGSNGVKDGLPRPTTTIHITANDCDNSATFATTVTNNITTTVIDESRYYDEERRIFYPLTGIRPLTPGYLDLAHQPPVKLDTPKKLLVILDLNGTLFYSADDRSRNRNYIKRPYFVELLRFLYENCRVMIWSSATRQRVSKMITGGGFVGVDKMDRVWNREHLQLPFKDFHRKVLTLKDLEFVWRAIETERSEAKPEQLLAGGRYEFCYDQTNTVLIDDSPHKSQLQPHNCMIVPDFDDTRAELGGDQELLKVLHYLNDLLYQDNVSAYMRTSPFDTNSTFYHSQEFHDKVTALTATMKDVLKKAKKREARKVAQEKARVEKIAEDAPTRKLKKAQNAELEGTSDDRNVEVARTTEMFRVGEMTEAGRIPLKSQKAVHLTSPDWVVPDWTQQIAFEDAKEGGVAFLMENAGSEGERSTRTRKKRAARRAGESTVEITAPIASPSPTPPSNGLGPIRRRRRRPQSNHSKAW